MHILQLRIIIQVNNRLFATSVIVQKWYDGDRNCCKASKEKHPNTWVVVHGLILRCEGEVQYGGHDVTDSTSCYPSGEI